MRNIAPFLTLICLTGFFAAASPSFATLDNLGNILTQVSVTGIIAVGLTFVILCAEIDLSIASIANVTGIAVAYFTLQDSYVNIANVPMPGWAAILLALVLCALLGLVNALGLTVIGIPSFIMTLAMMQIAAGISALLVRGQIAYKVPDLITTLGSASIGGIPWIVIVAALMLLGGHLVLTYTRFGRYVYMVGGNREAAEYSGLNVKLILGSVMVISAVCSGIGGMLGVAHFGSAQQNEFDTYLLDSIAAVVVGGTSLFGGRGGIGNTIVGLFVLGVLNNGLDHVNIDSFLKILIRGLILLAALVINVYAQRLRERTAMMGALVRLTSPGEIRLPVAHFPRGLGHGADGGKAGRIHHHLAGEPQAPRLAGRAALRILDPLEIDIVRQPEDAADDFCGRKSDGIPKQPRHISLPLGLEPRRAGLARKQLRRICVAFGLGAPQLEEFAGEPAPDVFDRLQDPSFERSPLARRSLVAGGGEIAHREIANDRTDIESHRPVECEFGIDHPRLVLRHHDRAGVQVAMDHRFRRCQELQLQPRDRDMQIEVLAEARRSRIEPRRGPAVLLGPAVGIGEDQILGDLAQRMVAGERGDPFLLLRGRHSKVRREEQRPRHEGRDVVDEARIAGSARSAPCA